MLALKCQISLPTSQMSFQCKLCRRMMRSWQSLLKKYWAPLVRIRGLEWKANKLRSRSFKTAKMRYPNVKIYMKLKGLLALKSSHQTVRKQDNQLCQCLYLQCPILRKYSSRYSQSQVSIIPDQIATIQRLESIPIIHPISWWFREYRKV